MGELNGNMSVMTAVAAKVTKVSRKEKLMAIIKVQHMLYEQLLWHLRSPTAHPTLNVPHYYEGYYKTDYYIHSKYDYNKLRMRSTNPARSCQL